ncbi:serine hydroxymethyltransferase [Candidatus Woesebacteria bacterium]|nr:serine hydroxymethyltransferase [Candidatus Woesebacteria bacterium]MCD8526999.1 serine hydroxymethyltransferase [Candidatus Woesebacteria bacterium]MCD8546761.1 serine hydroxymethyltransferase [Candidatus Woesebacteria bacterium]
MSTSVQDLITQEQERQESTIQLIPSENYTTPEVMAAVGSVFMNKYSEGYPHKRYYEGNEIVDQIELLAQERAKELFHVPHVNVQPYSGSPANAAIEMALMEPGDTFMGLQLASGGHLTHGHPKVTFGGKFFHSEQFGLNDEARIDIEGLRKLAKKVQPKVIIIGNTAYPFELNFEIFAEIAEEVGAWLVADISHVAGLVVSGEHPDPVPYAHVVMTTTHKTLRGPRGAMILVTEKGLDRDPKLGDKIDKAVFPGLQGGPHNNTTAGIAIALEQAAQPAFKEYGQQIRKNARALAARLQTNGLKLVGDGTETHLMIIDVREWGGGTQLAYAMAQAGLVANKNTVPDEPNSPFYPSGVRIGTPSVTTRGMKEAEMEQIADWITEIEKLTRQFDLPKDKTQRKMILQAAREWAEQAPELKRIREEVRELCAQFPMYE